MASILNYQPNYFSQKMLEKVCFCIGQGSILKPLLLLEPLVNKASCLCVYSMLCCVAVVISCRSKAERQATSMKHSACFRVNPKSTTPSTPSGTKRESSHTVIIRQHSHFHQNHLQYFGVTSKSNTNVTRHVNFDCLNYLYTNPWSK